MSLILEALKKLDREKQAPDRGFLVVGAVPWPSPRARRWRPALLAVAVVAAAGAAAWYAWPPRGNRGNVEAPRSLTPSTLAAPAVAAPSTMAPAPVTLPVPIEQTLPVAKPAPVPPAPASPAAEARPDAELRLEAIGERDGRPVAVISSRLVHEGERYDGITIVRIGADEVEIEVRGQRRTLRF